MSYIYLYPKWIRLWHLFNGLLFIILVVTGISMQYTDKNNNIFLVGFERAVKWHNVAAILLTLNYIFFVTGNIITRNFRFYKIEKKNFVADLITQFRFYSGGMFRGEKHPFPVTENQKFNPLQKFTYFLAMYIAMPLLIISGIGLMFPEITINRFFGVSGLILTDLLHVIMGFLLSVFMLIHIYTCTLGSTPGSLFRSMLSGYHESEEH
jgi:thiosulfate reductase cytochrome b subunit